MQQAFRFIDLYAGIGGFRLGLEAVGGQCVFTSEIDKHARQTYTTNFRCRHQVVGDIREIPAEQIPAHDLLVAGFPCQPFSKAGRATRQRHGIPSGLDCPNNGTAFDEITRILEKHRPAAFLLENVPGLANLNGGKTIRFIYKTLTEKLGYSVDYGILTATPYVPQNRQRLFITGTRKPTGIQIDRIQQNLADGPKLGSILHPEDGTEQPTPYTTTSGQVEERYTLSHHMWAYLKKHKKDLESKGWFSGFTYMIVPKNMTTPTLMKHYNRDGRRILVEQPNKLPRKLTPRECARLMGYPETYQINAIDREAYKQFGNSVVPPLVQKIAETLMPYWMQK